MPTRAPSADSPPRWPERRWSASIIRVVVFLTPLVVSFVIAIALSRALDVPDSLWMRLGRWTLIAIVALGAMLVTQRLIRRLLPLAALFSLTLVFPDETPSRFLIALRSRSARQLARQRAGIDGGESVTPAETIDSLLGMVAELSRHDRLTRGHSERVRAYAVMIGEEMELSVEEIDSLRWAGLLHDVGKLHVPSEILNKPGRLTDAEFTLVRHHPVAGRTIVAPLADWLGPSAAAVYEHHERWEGGGYPTGESSQHLSLASRIISVADAFDVMTSARSYKSPMSARRARSELQRCAGTQFDPAVVRAMMHISLGRLWKTMGPLSLIAQIGLFPRPMAQAGPAVNVVAAALVALLLAAVASATNSGAETDVVQSAPVDIAVTSPERDQRVPATGPPTAGAGPSAAPVVSDPPEAAQLPPIAPVPPGTTIAPPTATTTSSIASSPIVTSTTTSSPTTSAPATTVTPPTATTTTAAPPPTATTTTAAPPPTTTSTPTTTTTTTTPTTTTAPPLTTTSTTTTTTATTTIPPTPGVFVLGSSGAGDRTSSEFLPLEPERSPRNPTLPNYDTNRNDDPGLTVGASPGWLITKDPTGVQVWKVPESVNRIDGAVTLELWVAPGGPIGPAGLRVRAGIFDCDTGRTGCRRLVRSTLFLDGAVGEFAPVEFDLTLAGAPYEVAPGRHLELRFATLALSSTDAWIGFDSSETPSRLVFTEP